MANREWRELSHNELVTELQEGFEERERRIAEMMGVGTPQAAPRGPGRPRKDAVDLSTRAGQLAAAESERVQ